MMTAAKGLAEFLASAGLHPADDLEPFADAVSRLRASTADRDIEFVTRSVLVAAAAEVNPAVVGWLRDHGFDRLKYEEIIGRRALRIVPDDDTLPLNEELMIPALDWYRGSYGGRDRPIDVAGLTAAIVATANADVRRRLIQAGLRIDQATRSAEKLLLQPLELQYEAIVDPYGTLPIGALARHILEYATRYQERSGRVTTSTLIIAMLEDEALGQPRDSYPSFLRSRILSRAKDRISKRISEWLDWYRPDPSSHPGVTAQLYELLRDGREIALRVTGAPEIRGRHLVGAIMCCRDTNLGAVDFIRSLDIDPDELAREFLSQLEAEGARERDHDDLRAWRRILRIEDPTAVPRYDAEGYAGGDHLEIGADVDAFATLIASTELQPPLSIGLFGDWGSGKSFFMSQLRDAIDDLAGSGDSFHRKIVQIDFNAWHYVEANLWASLVENIFRNLRAAGEKKETVEERRKAVMEKIDDAALKRAQREAAVEEKRIDRDAAAQKLETKKNEVENATKRLSLERVRDVWDSLTIVQSAREQLTEALKSLGVNRVLDSTEDVRATVEEIRSLGGRTKLLWVWLTQKTWPWWLLFAAVLVGPFALAALHAKLADYLPLLRQVSARISELAGLIAAVAGWLGVQLKRGGAALKKLEDAKAEVEKAVQKEEMKKKQKMRNEQRALEDGNRELASAQQALEEADKEFQDAQKELLDLSPGRQLARFIDDRAASNDYRRLLGVLATARNDFETLSALMRQQEDPTLRRRFPDLAQLDEKHRIDRIVLYIDDLDRCPPARVVEVLQAVHLLLAFKLFVVIVGVDARWVSEALEYKHRDVWRRKGKNGRVPGHTATPRDYLEKIFQIPFWLKPIDAVTTKRFVGRLLESDLGTSQQDGGDDDDRRGGGGIADGVATPASGVGGREPPTLHVDPGAREHLSNPTQLTLRSNEIDYMKELAPLVGRSPRTVKRYINTYRIIRAGIPPRRLEAFLDETDVAGYQAVLLLLAVVVGTPDVTHEVFESFERADPEREIMSMIAEMDGTSTDWTNVRDALKAFDERNGHRPRVRHLHEHIAHVRRYSFDTLAHG
jgi:hypothetical protein